MGSIESGGMVDSMLPATQLDGALADSAYDIREALSGLKERAPVAMAVGQSGNSFDGIIHLATTKEQYRSTQDYLDATEAQKQKTEKDAAKQRKTGRATIGVTVAQSTKTLDDDWQSDSNCLGVDAKLFFPERGESTREAKAVCEQCVVRELCLEDSLQTGEKHGIRGGLSERERRRIRKNRAEAAKTSQVA